MQHGAVETGSAPSQVLSAASLLASDSNRLKLEVGKFLDTVRAAWRCFERSLPQDISPYILGPLTYHPSPRLIWFSAMMTRNHSTILSNTICET